MIGRYTMGAWEGLLRLGVRETGPCNGARRRSTARDDFEDLEFLAVQDDFRDWDGRPAPHDDDAVGANALGAQDLFDGGPLARKLDTRRRLVEPAADGNFGRNPSVARLRANA